jgi:hypothetical protein
MNDGMFLHEIRHRSDRIASITRHRGKWTGVPRFKDVLLVSQVHALWRTSIRVSLDVA